MRAIEIRLGAEKKAGRLLSQRQMAKGAAGNPGGRGAPVVQSHDTTTQTLEEIGISKDQSSCRSSVPTRMVASVPKPATVPPAARKAEPDRELHRAAVCLA